MRISNFISILLTFAFVNLASSVLACMGDDESKNTKKRSGHHSAKKENAQAVDKAQAVATPDEGPDSHVVKIDTLSETLKGTVNLEVKGMRCSSCKEKLEAAIKKLPEVKSVTANVKEKSLEVTLNADLSKATLAKAIEDAGFNPN